MEPNLFRYIWSHSRREQLVVLALVIAALPFYWFSLDIPKLIINEALQGAAFKDGNTTAKLFDWSFQLPDWLGGGMLVLSKGYSFEQVGYLMALSFTFLFFVVVNGVFKYFINTKKGILAERMLRRMRFELFSLMMRFRPEEISAVKPAEAASMIKDEVEPIGGFVGDAFIQPVFLGTQALTALAFILTQNMWLGVVAMAIVLVQTIIIPILRRELLRLARERQITARVLAGRIGEIVDSAPTIHAHGTVDYSEAEIGGRLGNLFNIRLKIYKRKFAIKFLNNLLAQITPFFFYSIGGYLAIKGQIGLGQLVAVIAAYRDLPPPIKELIDWDQQRADVIIKYDQIISQFNTEHMLPQDEETESEELPENPELKLSALRVVDQRGNSLLDSLTANIALPAHIALVGSPGSGRDVLAAILGRQMSNYRGDLQLAGLDLLIVSERRASSMMAYALPQPVLTSGSIRDNITSVLKRKPPVLVNSPISANELFRREEAGLTNNPVMTADEDWIDYEKAGATSADDLDAIVLRALSVTGFDEDIYEFGLSGKLGHQEEDVLDRVLAARKEIKNRLAALGQLDLIEAFTPEQFNTNAPLAENLLFGIVIGTRLSGTGLVSDPFFRAILEAESLIRPLRRIGLQIAENTLEIFSQLPPGHPLFDRYSMIEASELAFYDELVTMMHGSGARFRINKDVSDRLITLALSYVEPRHRLDLVNDELVERLLRARHSIMRYMPQDYLSDVEFYDPQKALCAATLRDNFLFGKVAYGIGNAEKKISALLRQVLGEMSLEPTIYRLGLDYDVGPGGKALFEPQRSAIEIARCLVRSTDVVVIDGGLSAFGADEARRIVERIKKMMEGRTLIMVLSEPQLAAGFDHVFRFEGGRGNLVSQKVLDAGHQVEPEPDHSSIPGSNKGEKI